MGLFGHFPKNIKMNTTNEISEIIQFPFSRVLLWRHKRTIFCIISDHLIKSNIYNNLSDGQMAASTTYLD